MGGFIMNLLIADDEYLVRASLKSMLSELDIEIEGVEEASDGEELMQKAVKGHPDLAFIDIKMPKMDGLESIKKIKMQCPNTSWIILTGFPVFEYAKEAVDLGVERYLLKPVSKEELSDSIHTVLKNKIENQTQLNFEFSNDLSALFNRYTTGDCLQESNVILSYHFMGAVIFLDGNITEDTGVKLQQKLWNMNVVLQKKYIASAVRIAFIKTLQGNYITVFGWDPHTNRAEDKSADLYFTQLTEIAKNLSLDGCSISILHGGECSDFDRLQDEIRQIQKLSCLRVALPKPECAGLDRLTAKQKTLSPQMLKLIETVAGIPQKYRNGFYGEYLKEVERLEGYLFTAHLSATEAEPLLAFLKCCCPEKCPRAERDLKPFIDALKESGMRKLNQNNEIGDLVDKTILFVQNNYMRNIGIAQIANELKVTPNYLSALFHKKTGENFMHYLTKTRLLKAKELLLSSDNPQVNQVAKQVGYYTVNYFTRLYKKYFGICPSEDISCSATNTDP